MFLFLGRMFGDPGILTGFISQIFCILLLLTLQDGVKPSFQWINENERLDYHIVQMIQHVFNKIAGLAFLLLNQYYLFVSALQRMKRFIKLNAQISNRCIYLSILE